MKQTTLLILGLTYLLSSSAQELNIYTLKSLTDSFTYSEVGFTNKFAFGDTLSFGTGYYKNIFKISTDIDSIKFTYDSTRRPSKQGYSIKIKSPKGEQIIYVTFREASCWFTNKHIQNSAHQVKYEISEIYELANVLYTLTNSSQVNPVRTFKNTNYYDEVLTYFAKFKNDSLIKKLEFPDDVKGGEDYYNFRDNSICFEIDKGKIVPNNQYYVVWGDIKDNFFAKNLTLINDFYNKSNFHSFYQQHKNFYYTLIKEEQKYMPAKKMWSWLEENFNEKIDACKISFSPLIWGSHATQIFYWIEAPAKFYSEANMFISSVRDVAHNTKLNESQKEGIASGIVFTEIDHNYCNPVSSQYQKEIDSALSNRDKWVEKGGDEEDYPTAMAVFNEYITHAVYILYVHDHFNKEDFEVVKKEREGLMIKQRKYIKFREFTEALLALYENKKPNQTISDLFPKIIEWCSTQN